ncbi:response regulator [Nonomuraea wenchangensis]|uniref:Two-component system, NarL family, response regulator LiaR n=1 Tax=Nonomuraea wenchangensis TaxID=568860 RepID=A0A1I0LMJ8_9ACTN|nr:response regulator transcription factor [Nonomuraea wenchangensis]SEU41674.1 two-component system, NarL family, response regulator LiaR [Nonomuraea wenchangensis]
MSVRVLIVDDHEVVRQGLRFVLEQEDGIEVVGEAGDGEAALRAVRALRPDVMLLDLVMPVMDGLRALRALREAGDGPAPAVIVLTSFQEEDRVVEAVRLGALSFLSKTSAVDRVVEAVRAAAHGGSVLEPGIAALLVRQVRRAERPRPLDTLTPRERDVLAALARGRSNAEIARDLRMGRETVKSHVSSVLAKLGVSDRTQAAIYALQQGLVPLDEAL